MIEHVYALPGRSTRAIVDLDAIAANVAELRKLTAAHTALVAIVKADGYGHGAVMTSRTALAAGASMLGVATIGEGAELRQRQITAPILLLGPCDPSELHRALILDLALTVGSEALLMDVDSAAAGLGKCARVHLKIDTGMHRYGATPRDALSLADRCETLDNVELVALSTHLSTADTPAHAATTRQSAIFEEAAAQINSRLVRTLPVHSANSAAGLSGMARGAGMVRFGISMYGLPPAPEVSLPPGISPAMSIISRLSRVHLADSGSRVSYGHTYVCKRPELLGLIPIGYGDGYRRALSNRGTVQVGDARCPVRGMVCMDQMVIGNLQADAVEGDFVGVAGPIGDGPGFDALAEIAGTIPYEVVAGISGRVPRYYVGGGRVVATLLEGTLDCI